MSYTENTAKWLGIWLSCKDYYCYGKTPGSETRWETRVCLAYASTSLFIVVGSHDIDLNRAGQMQRTWRGASYWLASHGLFTLLSYRTQDHQCGLAPPTMD